eukprot:6459337-Amphidinium_carterae.1
MAGVLLSGARRRLATAALKGPFERARRPASGTAGTERNWKPDCVCSEAGEWHLTAGRATRNGTYRFDPKTCKLYDQTQQLLAKVVYEPIGKEVLQEGTVFVPEIVQSEIIKEIQNVENDGAFFVLPSQLNGAEYVSYDAPCDLMSHYLWDNTAGPRGQLAIHPAIGQFLLDSASRIERPDGIDVTKAVFEGMPSPTREGFWCQNGYLKVPRWRSDEDFQVVHKAMEAALPRFHTIAALDAVVDGLGPSLKEWAGSEHRVNMVYASAVPVGTYNNPATSPETQHRQQVLSSLLMRGAYFGALKLALERARASGSPTRVFFMPLGGG